MLGLVGKPSAGKSTFFAAATMAPVEISDRPFTTIEPNVGTAYVRVEDIGKEFGVVPTPRTGFLAGKWRFVPVKLIDVAGLIPGAHEGKGLGNQFLNDLNQAEALIHVVDMSGSTDEEGNFIGYGKHDPEKDILFLEEELNHWYKNVIERNMDKMKRLKRSGRSDEDILVEMLSSFRVDNTIAEEVIEKFGTMEEWQDIFKVAVFLREKTKKIVIAGNKIDLPHAQENYDRLKEKYDIIPCSAEAELALKRAAKAGLIDYIPGEATFKEKTTLNEQQKAALSKIETNVLDKLGGTGVQKVIEHAVFNILNYIAVFPAGSKLEDSQGRILPDCFLLKDGSTLYDFAMKIHSDIAKALLYGMDARTRRRLAKDYVLHHRDAVELVSAAK
ncbi:MAG: redox-regulated ATPase YchF [Methanobacteriota archaeon]|nr:MAG: redox-regulated ATPase YchF [Euryarchaeota archaeon]